MSTLTQQIAADKIQLLQEGIHEQAYERQRVAPAYADELYLHLADLLRALKSVLPEAKGTWLDYGSGCSPYRHLLSGATLRLADIVPHASHDYVLVPGQPCPAPDDSFDGILSTQVLEHVRDAQFYLRDCCRLLRPAGRLVLTTHGIWEDHGCPDDYWRWTADGLREEVRRAGFRVDKCLKVTTGLRALLQLLHAQRFLLLGYRRHPVGLCLHLAARMIRRFRAAINRYADAVVLSQSVTDDPKATIYLAILVVATKEA